MGGRASAAKAVMTVSARQRREKTGSDKKRTPTTIFSADRNRAVSLFITSNFILLFSGVVVTISC